MGNHGAPPSPSRPPFMTQLLWLVPLGLIAIIVLISMLTPGISPTTRAVPYSEIKAFDSGGTCQRGDASGHSDHRNPRSQE